MSRAKKIGLVAIVLALGLSVFVISDQLTETATPDRPKQKSEISAIRPSKKESNAVQPKIQREKKIDSKPNRSRKVTQRSTQAESSSAVKDSVTASNESEPILTERSHSEDLSVDEESKEKENEVVSSALVPAPELPKEEKVVESPKGKYFKFEVFTKDGSSLPATIHSVDLQRGRELASYKTDNYVDIPQNRKSLTLVCGVFGYKLVEKVIDYNNPSSTEGAYQDERGAWVIPYTIEPLAKGDISIMYNVAFYKDAVVMLPQSKQDLDQLVNMMQKNQYAIRIHGHCNGTYNRKIIALGDSQNFFDVNGSREIYGTAKQLSAFRAEAVRSYLLENNIAVSRLKTQAWGGSYELVDENSPSAKLNDRIEIEILKDRRYVSAK